LQETLGLTHILRYLLKLFLSYLGYTSCHLIVLTT
jgi:hypothetical protein